MWYRCFFAIVFLFISYSGYSQWEYKKFFSNKISTTSSGEKIDASVWGDSRRIKTCPELQYSWFSAGKVITTQGGYSGRLLNGPYMKYYSNKNLKEQGMYYKGIRDGRWTMWNANGSLNSITEWKKGLRHGNFFIFDSTGLLLRKGKYRKDKLYGSVYDMSVPDTITSVYYKRGKPIVRKSPFAKIEKLIPRFLIKKIKNKFHEEF